jgi:universal protein Kae1
MEQQISKTFLARDPVSTLHLNTVRVLLAVNIFKTNTKVEYYQRDANMICLGIESTAHTFGVGIVSDRGKVLANAAESYRPPKGWGIKPGDAAGHHEKARDEVLKKALGKAGIALRDVDVFSFSQGPGLPPCLRIGRDFARELAGENRKPLVPVNHCIAHIEIGRLFTKARDPVTLYVSGGNTQILSHVEGRYRCFGETMDIGIGNALDKLGRGLGLPFPAGPEIEKLAIKGEYVEIPYVVKGMDLSFSGIVTEATRRFKQGEKAEDVCFSFQETAFAMLTEVTERALAHVRKSEVLLTGGVAANLRLQEMLGTMCRERKAKFFAVPAEFSGDNGVMIAWTGILMKSVNPPGMDIKPRQRTDEVEVTWV